MRGSVVTTPSVAPIRAAFHEKINHAAQIAAAAPDAGVRNGLRSHCSRASSFTKAITAPVASHPSVATPVPRDSNRRMTTDASAPNAASASAVSTPPSNCSTSATPPSAVAVKACHSRPPSRFAQAAAPLPAAHASASATPAGEPTSEIEIIAEKSAASGITSAVARRTIGSLRPPVPTRKPLTRRERREREADPVDRIAMVHGARGPQSPKAAR